MAFHKATIAIAGLLALAACTPPLVADTETPEQQKQVCLDSVKKYMNEADAEHFCGQPEWCRKWWDDLTEKEKREMQPPKWRKDSSPFDTCSR